jgi:hypothetical protein
MILALIIDTFDAVEIDESDVVPAVQLELDGGEQ